MKKKRKPTPEERAAYDANLQDLRERVARGWAELDAKRRAEAGKPRGLRRLLPF